MRKELSISEIIIALCLTLGGILVAVGGGRYGFGTSARLGAGTFPFILGSLMAGLGVGLSFQACRSAKVASQMTARPIISVLAALAIFSLLVERFGMIPATIAMVMVASLAEAGQRRYEVVAVALVVSLLTTAIFVYALKMPLRAFAW